MKWYWWVLIANFVGGYIFAVISLFLWQKTNRLRGFKSQGFMIRIVCMVIWPMSLYLEYLKKKKSDYNDGLTFMDEATAIGRLRSDSYLGLMVVVGFYPKLLYMAYGLVVSVWYAILHLPIVLNRAGRSADSVLGTLGTLVKPKCIK